MPEFVATGISTTWVGISTSYVRDNGIWRRTISTHVRDGGVWRNILKSPAYFYSNPVAGGSLFAGQFIQTFTIPTGVTQITAEVWGAGGAAGSSQIYLPGNGGGGGYVKATIPVGPLGVVPSGATLQIRVGGGGGFPTVNQLAQRQEIQNGFDTITTQFFNGGTGGSGGGLSGVFTSTGTALLIAGGGGGGGGVDGFTESSTTVRFGGNGGAGGSSGQSGQSGTTTIGVVYGSGGGGGGSAAGGSAGESTNIVGTKISGTSGSDLRGGAGGNSLYTTHPNQDPIRGSNATGGSNGGGAAGAGRVPNGTLAPTGGNRSRDCGGGGGSGFYGGGGGGPGGGAGGGGGGGGSNYVITGALNVTNSSGNLRIPGNTTSPYYIQSQLFNSPFIAYQQGGVGYGGLAVDPAGPGTVNPVNTSGITATIGARGENGLVVIYW